MDDEILINSSRKTRVVVFIKTSIIHQQLLHELSVDRYNYFISINYTVKGCELIINTMKMLSNKNSRNSYLKIVNPSLKTQKA